MGGGVKNSENVTDVLYVWSLSQRSDMILVKLQTIRDPSPLPFVDENIFSCRIWHDVTTLMTNQVYDQGFFSALSQLHVLFVTDSS